MKRGLSGYIPVRNGIALDYCWREAILSMLPVVDELIVCDSDSDDGTADVIREWCTREPKLLYANYLWPDPVGQPRMLIDWLNYARQFCQYDMQITCDADEVLCPKGYDVIREVVEARDCAYFRRLNFWKDAQHTAQDGWVCGTHVARLAPTELMMVSDEPRPEGEPEIRRRAQPHPDLRFFHYGFLRRNDAFLAKSRVMQRALHNTYDPRLRKAEETGVHWTDSCDDDGVCSTCFPLVPYTENDHPAVAWEWLRERGYNV